MTLSRHQTIQRARNAAALLMDGHSLLDTTFDAGYFDQAHLTRSLRGLSAINARWVSVELWLHGHQCNHRLVNGA